MKNFNMVEQHWLQKRKDFLASVWKVAENFMLENDLRIEFRAHEVELAGSYAFILEEAVKDLLHDLDLGIIDLVGITIDVDNPYEGDMDNFVSDTSWNLIEELEHILVERNRYLPDPNRDGNEDGACIFGDVYYGLEEEFKQEVWSILHDFIKIANS